MLTLVEAASVLQSTLRTPSLASFRDIWRGMINFIRRIIYLPVSFVLLALYPLTYPRGSRDADRMKREVSLTRETFPPV